MSSEQETYYLIFDTNILYQAYDKKGDFSKFSFNSTFDNVIGLVNQLDIYEYVTLVIPEVTWNEMREQIIEAHDAKLNQFKASIHKYSFPEVIVEEKNIGDYASFIDPVIDAYRRELASGVNRVIELPLAGSERYHSIVRRAFEKRPPFEGKEKKSDKGFKDALLWESILAFSALHSKARIIYYTKDSIFNSALSEEFASKYPEAKIYMCSDETDVKEQLETWAKEIDEYSYTPVSEYIEYEGLVNWINSADFLVQVIDRDFGLADQSRLVVQTEANLVSYDNICLDNRINGIEQYIFDAVLELVYSFKDGGTIKEKINVTIAVDRLIDDVYDIADVYIDEEE